MARLIWAQCGQNLMRRSNLESSRLSKHLWLILGTASRVRIRPAFHLVLGWMQGRREGGELFVLRLGRQGLMEFGVVDDVAKQLLPQRGKRAFPEFPRGLALSDENPVLGGDGTGIH